MLLRIDVKKIMAEEFYQVYMKANEECIIEKEKDSPPGPAKRAKFGTKAMTLLQSSLISLCGHMPMRASGAVLCMCAHTGMCVYERWRSL